MKYAIIIPDGASDEPQESLGGLTPLQKASIPNMDRIALDGAIGLAKNVPDCFVPASDVATLSLCGYDPEAVYTGRAPLEAAAMGIALGPDDWAIRCNLMTIDDGRMADFTAGHISSEEGRALIAALQKDLGQDNIEFHPGVSYRNLMVYRAKPGEAPFASDTLTTPPHDVPDLPARDYPPKGTGASRLADLMVRGAEVVKRHSIYASRIASGKHPANAIWLWGQGKAPTISKFADLHGIRGAMISAVDLVRGVGILAGWDRIDAPGATGYLDTDYASKGRTGIAALETHDLVCVHVEAPDEASHEGRADAKVEALERMDADIVGPLLSALKTRGDYRILISPDHSTLLRTRAHDRAPVPWAIAGAGFERTGGVPDGLIGYDETSARASASPMFDPGWRLMESFLQGPANRP